jgi:hypothetical protein
MLKRCELNLLKKPTHFQSTRPAGGQIPECEQHAAHKVLRLVARLTEQPDNICVIGRPKVEIRSQPQLIACRPQGFSDGCVSVLLVKRRALLVGSNYQQTANFWGSITGEASIFAKFSFEKLRTDGTGDNNVNSLLMN